MATTPICSVDGCGKGGRLTRGWCEMHYNRWKRHGDPTAGRAFYGEAQAWLLSHVSHTGDGCLIWPFGRATDGYGITWMDGVAARAHRRMCEEAHGKPPTPKHDAAHNCGRGHEGCVHPGHLRWATRAENSNDRHAHGTMTRGAEVHNSKLTEEEVRAIRALRNSVSKKAVAMQFGISASQVRSIQERLQWAWLE